MDEKQQLQVSLFRFGVISDIVSGARLERGELERLIKEKSKRRWNIPFSNRTRLSQEHDPAVDSAVCDKRGQA